jgi:type IV conjugative transfer system pilin TraA
VNNGKNLLINRTFFFVVYIDPLSGSKEISMIHSFNQETQKRITWFLFALAIGLLFVTQPALAEDLFASGKDSFKASAGEGSMVEMAVLGFGLLGAAVLGFSTRNWFAAVGGFFGGMLFWEVGTGLVGLGGA